MYNDEQTEVIAPNILQWFLTVTSVVLGIISIWLRVDLAQIFRALFHIIPVQDWNIYEKNAPLSILFAMIAAALSAWLLYESLLYPVFINLVLRLMKWTDEPKIIVDYAFIQIVLTVVQLFVFVGMLYFFGETFMVIAYILLGIVGWAYVSAKSKYTRSRY